MPFCWQINTISITNLSLSPSLTLLISLWTEVGGIGVGAKVYVEVEAHQTGIQLLLNHVWFSSFKFMHSSPQHTCIDLFLALARKNCIFGCIALLTLFFFVSQCTITICYFYFCYTRVYVAWYRCAISGDLKSHWRQTQNRPIKFSVNLCHIPDWPIIFFAFMA